MILAPTEKGVDNDNTINYDDDVVNDVDNHDDDDNNDCDDDDENEFTIKMKSTKMRLM